MSQIGDKLPVISAASSEPILGTQDLVRLRKPAASSLNRRRIVTNAYPRDKSAALRFAAGLVQLKFGAQRRALQFRLMMRQGDKIVRKFVGRHSHRAQHRM